MDWPNVFLQIINNELLAENSQDASEDSIYLERKQNFALTPV